VADLERSSTEFRFFLPTMITSLLATPEYIRAALANVPGDHSKAISRKLDRQRVLHDDAKSFVFLLTEQAVRWPLLPAPAMAVQIDRLVSVSRLPSVRLGVLPLDRRQIPLTPLSMFTVYDRRMATVETPTGVMVFQGPRNTSVLVDEFSRYERHALWGDGARNRLRKWARLLRN
jgi:hypothetical protein